MLTNFNEDFKVPTDAFKFVNSLDKEAKNYDKDLRRLCQNAISEFGDMQDKSAEVASNIKAVNVETKKVQQELKTNNSNDQSGYLDVSTIETYGNAIDKVLGNIAQKQEDINAKRQRAVDLERTILSNTTLTREGLSRELEEYTKVLNKFDTEKITKIAASLKETRAAAEQPVQTEQIQPTQPKKKEPVKLGGGGISGFNKEKSEETTVPIKGKITITDADISVDVKNPVQIPGVAVIDSSAAQVGNADDLRASADALASANKSLNSIAGKTEGYASNISALGPAFQYVAQEVDNLSHSLENQILDFNKISEQTNAYIGKTASISIDTSNVAVTGEPAAITGKVVLGAEDVVPPEAPVDIKGHVELKATDITPPSEPVELQGKIAKTTMESAAKGKKKKGQDIEKPEVVELTGHVKLEDKDIERPDPVVMNGKVVVTKNNIKLPEGGIDVKGNLILKNAEIANAIKEAAGKESGKKGTTKSKTDSSIIDTKAQQEDNRLLQQEEQLQQRIADTAQKKADAENKSFDRDVAAAQKKYGTVEEAEAVGKVPTSIQLALQTQQQLIDAIGKTTIGTEEYNNAVKAAEANWKNVKIEIDASNKAQKKLSDQTTSILRKFETLKEEASQGSNEELKNGIEGILTRARNLNTKDPHTYENYTNELIQLKQDSYAVQAKHTLWHKSYKGLEKKGTQIAQGVEVARQMQEDGSLQDIDFKNIDELIAKLNTLPAQSDTYAETLKEIDTLWQEIKKQVDAVNESEKQAAKKQTAKIRDVKNILTAQRQNKNLIETVRGNNGSSEEFYSQLSEKQSKLSLLFEAIDGTSDSEQALKTWASQNLKESADNINSVTDAIRTLDKEYNDAQSSAESFNRTISQERSTNKAATEVANLKSQIHDYLETNKKIQSSNLTQPFQNLMNALNSETAPEKIGELKKQFAELRAQAKELGLESESLIDKFEKLFGTHFSTMITMAALHQMQAALRQVYQNVVDIDTAVTELRKVSEYAGKSLEEYMSRASEQAQKLGVSISDYINSTAD